MRRKDREITDKEAILAILKEADACRLAFNTGNAPYIVPLNYGYLWEDKLELFVHSANQGRKLELLEKDNRVGFEIDTAHELLEADQPCNWGMKYKSIIGTGIISVLEDSEKRKTALDQIMKHYGFEGKAAYHEGTFNSTKVLHLVVEEFTVKQKR